MISVQDHASAAKLRERVIEHIWKGAGIPRDAVLDDRSLASQSPIAGIANLRRVERLSYRMPLSADEGGGAFVSHAYHFEPVARADRLVVFHHGHSDDFGEYGADRTVRYFVDHGFDVLALFMPLFGPNTAPPHIGSHNEMMALESPSRCPLQLFLEPVFVLLAELNRSHRFADTSMIGISGGGWATHLIAAIDPSIQLSIPVAGSLPIDLRLTPFDGEQAHALLYDEIAGYRDLYILAATDGRRQLQVLNRDDDCCFFGTSYRGYENEVRARACRLGGTFDVYLDITEARHTISSHLLESILPDLFGDIASFVIDDEGGFGYPGSSYGTHLRTGSWRRVSTGFAGQSFVSEDNSARASWRFVELTPGAYRIFVTWRPAPQSSSKAAYEVISGERSQSTIVDQRAPPTDLEDYGTRWHLLADAVEASDEGALEVVLTGDGRPIVADAVRIELVTRYPAASASNPPD